MGAELVLKKDRRSPGLDVLLPQSLDEANFQTGPAQLRAFNIRQADRQPGRQARPRTVVKLLLLLLLPKTQSRQSGEESMV